MLLARDAILAAVACGDIACDPFDPAAVGPNSLDVRLGPTLLVYDCPALDMRADNPTRELTIPPEGLLLRPGILYLASTVEAVGSTVYVPCLEGRSSTARLGMEIHRTAGVGDRGFLGKWTCEISVIHPVRVYAGARIGQFLFWEAKGGGAGYAGKYAGESGPVACRMWQDADLRGGA